jgi:hypothetical protein
MASQTRKRAEEIAEDVLFGWQNLPQTAENIALRDKFTIEIEAALEEQRERDAKVVEDSIPTGHRAWDFREIASAIRRGEKGGVA